MSVVRVTAADNQSADVQDFNHGGAQCFLVADPLSGFRQRNNLNAALIKTSPSAVSAGIPSNHGPVRKLIARFKVAC